MHSWDLGVCRDSVSRKGLSKCPHRMVSGPLGSGEDYWALTIAETHLTLREKPLVWGYSWIMRLEMYLSII